MPKIGGFSIDFFSLNFSALGLSSSVYQGVKHSQWLPLQNE